MKVETTLSDDNRAKVSVEIGPDRIAQDFDHALAHVAQRVKVPGFRQGKVPHAVALKQLGRDAVFAETLAEFLPQWMGEALTDANLRPSDRPSVEHDGAPAEGEPFRFIADFPLWPKGTLLEDLNLEAVRDDAPPIDDEIDAELERLRLESSPLSTVERAAGTGDFVEVDLNATVGGKALPDGSTTGYVVQLGSGGTSEEIERAIRGLSAGATKSVELTLDAEYPDRKLRGRTATVEIKLHAVRERAPRDLDDAMAKECSEFDTLTELKGALRSDFQERVDHAVNSRFRANVLGDLGRQVEVELPPYCILDRVEDLLGGMARSIERQGVPFQTWLQASGQSLQQVRQMMIPEAIDSLKREIGLATYADTLKITISDDELRKELLHELDHSHTHAPGEEHDHEAAVQEVMDSPAKENARDELRLQRALDRAVEQATPITREQAEAKQKLWTPGDDDNTETVKPGLWTPGQPQ